MFSAASANWPLCVLNLALIFLWLKKLVQILLLKIGLTDLMAGLSPHETYLITATVPSTPAREASRALNIPGAAKYMQIDDEILMAVPVNTVMDVESVRVGSGGVGRVIGESAYSAWSLRLPCGGRYLWRSYYRFFNVT